jgi:Ca2+-binding EF-hand superfamily protein
MKRVLLIVPAFALLLTGRSVLAEDDAPANPIQAILKQLKDADKNGDGKLSKEEAPGPLKEHFDKVDANKDGFADAGELRKAIQVVMRQAILKNLGEQLKKADKNGDGKLSLDEVPEQFRPAFDRIDTNSDGFVDKKEVGQALAKIGEAVLTTVQKFKEADKNGDGKLSKQEAPEPLKANFDKVDANQDGFVDGQEVMRALGEVIKRALKSEG